MSAYLAAQRKANASSVSKISAEEAAKLISQTSPSRSKLTFDKDEASRLNVNFGDIVSIVPEDNGVFGLAVTYICTVADFTRS